MMCPVRGIVYLTCVTVALFSVTWALPRGRPVLDIGSGPGYTEQGRIILLILRQKCQQWKNMGVTPLPSYCYSILKKGSSGPTTQLLLRDLKSYYRSMLETSSDGNLEKGTKPRLNIYPMRAELRSP